MKTRQPTMSRRTSLAVMWAAYLWALAVSLSIGLLIPVESPLVKAGIVDLIATVMVFAVSVIFDNSSIYDPYWSVAPIVMTGYWVAWAAGDSGPSLRGLIVLLLVTVWGIRLTVNFLTHWRGMRHEDWRYVGIREKTGRNYWLASFFGIHLFPTVIVFAACLPVFFACTSRSPLGLLDVVAVAVTVAAIVYETVADAQMRASVGSGAGDGTTFRGGLWAYSRHPNYLGEMVFWWGLFLFALAAGSEFWWTFVGPLGVTLLFLRISLPLIETRMAERRSDYRGVQVEVSKLVPRFPKHR